MRARTGFRLLDAPAQNALELPASDNSIRRSEQLLAECPLVISAEAPTLGAREKLTDVIDLVVTNPETASVEQIREVASLARLLLRRHPA
jgi:hypothetical protein